MIVISGISSSLGISLAKLLVSKKIPVIGFARRIDKVKEILKHPLIELKSADLNDLSSMRSICSRASGVVHIAALSSPWGKHDDFYRINVEGTRNLIQAAVESNIERFVHTSTPSIYFNYQDRFDIKENEPLPKRFVNAYAKTKMEAEEVVDLAFSKGLPCITIRPRAIFGPHDQSLFPRVLDICKKKGSLPSFQKRSPLIDITYVDNVAYALWLALTADSNCFGQKYNITNGKPTLLYEVLDLLTNHLSIPMKRKRVPYFLAYLTACFSECIGRWMNQEPLFTRYGVGLMKYSQTLSIEKARKELKYQPLISIEEGIKRYAEWFQTQ